MFSAWLKNYNSHFRNPKHVKIIYRGFDIPVRLILTLLFTTHLMILSACDHSQDKTLNDLNQRISDEEIVQSPRQLRHVHEDDIIRIGFDLRSSPQEDARQYLPFLKYMESKTNYKFKIHFTNKNSNIIDDLGDGHVQFAFIGATSFIEAQEQYNAKPIVRGINHKGRAEYRSFFIVKPNSTIKDINDIKGKRLAFGSKTSTQGHLIPRIIMEKNKINLSDFAVYEYTGSHQNCANAVISGKYDICVMQDTMASELEEQGLVRTFYKSDYYPSSGVAANKDVPPVVVKKVKQAMLDFEPKGRHQEGLYNWDRTEMPNGFVEAMSVDYTKLREWSMRLGFNEAVKNQE